MFVDPLPIEAPVVEERPVESRQSFLDSDYDGFALIPANLRKIYVEDKSNREVSSKLFRHMTNFVARLHGWHTGGDLLPSPHLQVTVRNDQRDMLNPTSRDVQLGAILDQCSGSRAHKKIAKRRIEFINGNTNSYARVLNGPDQFEQIKDYNDLASSIAALNKERDDDKKKAAEKKKQDDTERADKRAEKERKEKAERERLAPELTADVERGLTWVLGLNGTRKHQMLKFHFGYPEGLPNVLPQGVEIVAISKLKVPDMNAFLRIYLPQPTFAAEGGVDGLDTTTAVSM